MDSEAESALTSGSTEQNPELTIGELADRARVSRRTVRFYVQRGLIDPPAGRGRGSAYSQKHLDQIQRVLRLQRTGLQLDSISELESKTEPEIRSAIPPLTSLVLRIPLRDGVVLELPADAGQPSDDTLQKLAAACERILNKGELDHNSSADDTAETGADL